MKPLLNTFLIILLLQAGLIFFIPGLSNNNADAMLLMLISVVFALVFLFGSRRILNGLNVSQSRFNALFFGMMGLRMLTALIFIVIYLMVSRIVNKPGTIFLICSYFVYMGFEIKFILPKLRTDSEKSKNTDDARK